MCLPLYLQSYFLQAWAYVNINTQNGKFVLIGFSAPSHHLHHLRAPTSLKMAPEKTLFLGIDENI